MVRAIALALALIGCAHARRSPPEVFGERVPARCTSKKVSDACFDWWVEHLAFAMFGFRRYDDPAITAYVTEVGSRLVRASGERRSLRFVVIDDPDVQAFVIAGSTVYIHRGTLALLRSEAELAAVLAHELGHVRGGHTDLGERLRDLPRSEIEKAIYHRRDRDDEIQADESAVVLLRRAGYDPHAVATMLRALGGVAPEATSVPTAVHPRWYERIARAQAVAAAGERGERGEERYRARIASLIVGRDPRWASLVGSTAVFGVVRVALELPPSTTSSLTDDGAIELALATGGEVRIVLVNPAIGNALTALAPHIAVEVHRATSREVVAILVSGSSDDAGLARRLRQAIRPPTPAELARLTPTRVDLNASRRLWPDGVERLKAR